MLLSPNQFGLEALGDLYKFLKIKLPDGMIEKMDQLLKNDPSLFRKYAIRDAEIAALHAWKMVEFSRDHFNSKKPRPTLGGLSVVLIKMLWDQLGIDANEVLGTETIKQKSWNLQAGRPVTKRNSILTKSAYNHSNLAKEAYHGGRNEAYTFGFSDIAAWSDFDLQGAYTTALAAIRIPDYSKIQVTDKVSDFSPFNLGVAQISF